MLPVVIILLIILFLYETCLPEGYIHMIGGSSKNKHTHGSKQTVGHDNTKSEALHLEFSNKFSGKVQLIYCSPELGNCITDNSLKLPGKFRVILANNGDEQTLENLSLNDLFDMIDLDGGKEFTVNVELTERVKECKAPIPLEIPGDMHIRISNSGKDIITLNTFCAWPGIAQYSEEALRDIGDKPDGIYVLNTKSSGTGGDMSMKFTFIDTHSCKNCRINHHEILKSIKHKIVGNTPLYTRIYIAIKPNPPLEFVFKILNEPGTLLELGTGKPWTKERIKKLLSYDDSYVHSIIDSDGHTLAGVVWVQKGLARFYPGSEVTNDSYFSTRAVGIAYRRRGLAKAAGIAMRKRIGTKLWSAVYKNNINNATVKSQGYIQKKVDRDDIILYISQ